MADFDAQQAQVHAQAHQNQFDHDQARIAYLEQNVANMAYALHQLPNVPQPVLGPLSCVLLTSSASLVPLVRP